MPQSIAELIEAEGVTVAAGVPTLYAKLLQHFETQGRAPARSSGS